MLMHKFQEIFSEIKRGDWNEVLRICRADFGKKCTAPIERAYFEIRYCFAWGMEKTVQSVETENVVDALSSLGEEQIYLLHEIEIVPEVVYTDSGNNKQTVSGKYPLLYCEHEEPLWRELHYRFSGSGDVHIVKREELYAGRMLAGDVRVLFMDTHHLVLAHADGTIGERLEYNNEYLQVVLPDVEAGLWYDHNEFPALWERVQIDVCSEENELQEYHIYYYRSDVLRDGACFDKSSADKELPVVSVRSIDERSVAIELEVNDGSEKGTHQFTLDKSNYTLEVWRKGARRMSVMLYLAPPRKTYGTPCMDVPPGSYITISSSNVPEPRTIQIVECGRNSSVPFGDPYCEFKVNGWENGKMIAVCEKLGFGRPKMFLGFLEEGKERTFQVDEVGSITVCWEVKSTGYEIADGVLLNAIDAEEIVVPEGVREIAGKALFASQQLRKITIPAGVEKFAYAIEQFCEKFKRKLEVCFDGDIQLWFDRSAFLANAINMLFVQGQEIHIYDCEELTIPAGVSRICSNMFARSNVLKSVIFPAEVTEIESGAFFACRNLCSVKIMGTAVVGREAFACCSNVEDIYLADGVVALESGCFNYISKVKMIFLPASVKTVGRINEQNHDADYRVPRFYCAAPSRPEGWREDWHLAYYDSRFGGVGNGHDFYHFVAWNRKRE